MHGTFYGSQFNGDISKWNVSNVTNMNSMFRHSPFDGDISDWDVSNVTNMSYMFNESQFDGDISKWDMSNVSNNEGMFDNSQFSGDISNLNISNNNSDSDEDECVCAFANEDDDADECVCAFANEDDDADSFSGNLHDCVVSSVNILLFRKQQNEGITCCSAIKKEDELAQKFIKHMGNDFSLVNELYGFKEGSFAYENVISFDGEDSKALAEADNYSEDTLESTVFYKIKDFCDDNDVVAFVSVLMNGLNCGVFSYKTVAAFISPDDLCYSSSSIYPEASEELIQRIMEKEGCDELEANEKALDSGEGFREAIESIYDDINDSFVGEHVACFEDNGINDISEISNDKEIMDEMKERSETGTVFVFENEYPWVALILSNVNDK